MADKKSFIERFAPKDKSRDEFIAQLNALTEPQVAPISLSEIVERVVKENSDRAPIPPIPAVKARKS